MRRPTAVVRGENAILANQIVIMTALQTLLRGTPSFHDQANAGLESRLIDTLTLLDEFKT